MVCLNAWTTKPEGNVSYQKAFTYLAIVCSVNESCVEFWVNYRALGNIVKERESKDRDLETKDLLATVYCQSQFLLVIATVASISQQANPIGIVSNSTGLLLIQQLDSQLFGRASIARK